VHVNKRSGSFIKRIYKKIIIQEVTIRMKNLYDM